MNITLTVVVAAIVILITALVVITIFGSGMMQVGSITQAQSLCETQCATSCRTTGQIPLTWNTPNIRVQGENSGEPISCGSKYTCDCNKYKT